MSRESHRRAKELFLEARTLAVDAQSAFLDRECAGSPELREIVEGMLGVEQTAPGFLSMSPFAGGNVLESQRTRIRQLVEQSNAAGRLFIEDEVARGGMGAILKVRDSALRRTVAMKIIHGQKGASSDGDVPGVQRELVDRFLDEAQVTGRLEHPGVVPVHELGVDSDGRLYFTMPLVGGRTLAEILGRVAQGDPDWSRTRALGVLQKVAETMAYAHNAGVVHRDLKPANVMVGEYGEVYVMDWGLARVRGLASDRDIAPDEDDPDRTHPLEDSGLRTRDGAILGTPYYMSPEQARGEIDRVDAASDVYALGSMLYHLLAGAPPYSEKGEPRSSHEVLAAVRKGAPPPLEGLTPGIPAELVAICERALAREPEDRYPDMDSMARDLQAFTEGRVVQAYRTGAWAEMQKWIGRNRLAATVGLIAVIAVLAGAIGVAAAERRSADLSRSFLIFYLEEESNRLWPATPELVPEMEQWLRDADETCARIDTAIAEFSGSPARQERMHDSIDRVEEIRAEMEDRIEFARNIERVSISGPEARAAWDEAIAVIRTSPIYQADPGDAPFDLSPQLGLVPLGENAATGLWEFWHVQTGERPEPNPLWNPAQTERSATTEWDPETCNRWLISEETGLVFVLIPAGAFAFGTERPSVGVETEQTEAGVRVTAVAEGSLAARAGVQVGDLLLSVAGANIRKPDDLRWVGTPNNRQKGMIQGSTVGLKVSRDGQDLRLTAEVEVGLGSPNIDPWGEQDEGPVYEFWLRPYFISKYEMTQGQWFRSPVRDPDPSTRGQGFPQAPWNRPQWIVDRTHPVETVSWDACSETLARLGLMIPTEAQWEKAARGGTGSVAWAGSRQVDLQGKENFGDRTAAETVPGWRGFPGVDDGFVAHSPVGYFQPNPFGLHDALGNLWEWTQDPVSMPWSLRNSPAIDDDGRREFPAEVEPSHRSTRGTCFKTRRPRVSGRNWVPQSTPLEVVGVRPARAVQP